jgi:hypothetical protein
MKVPLSAHEQRPETEADNDVCDQSHTLYCADNIQSQQSDGISNLNYRIKYRDIFAFQ